MNLLTDAQFTQPYDQIKGSYSTLHWPCKEVLGLLSDPLEGVRHSHVHGHLLTRLVITKLDSICKVVDIFNHRVEQSSFRWVKRTDLSHILFDRQLT